jgi:hypothetical protein
VKPPPDPVVRPQPDPVVKPPEQPKQASLFIDSDPPCGVTLDGKPAGQTPLEIKNVTPGSRQVLLTNRDKGISKQMSIPVAAGEERREKIKFVPGTIIFRVQPWAYVEVDGKPQGQTPIPDGVQVYEGEHRVRLYNTELKKETVKQIQVKAGGKEVVKVNFLDG